MGGGRRAGQDGLRAGQARKKGAFGPRAAMPRGEICGVLKVDRVDSTLKCIRIQPSADAGF